MGHLANDLHHCIGIELNGTSLDARAIKELNITTQSCGVFINTGYLDFDAYGQDCGYYWVGGK